MASFDGTEFVGIDATALFGDGTSDGSTYALSTYAENRLYGNQAYLRSRGIRTSFAPLTQAADPRKFSVNASKASYWHGWFQLGPAHKTFRVDLLGFVDDVVGSTIADIEATLQMITSAGGQRNVVEEVITSFDEGSTAGEYAVEVDLTNIVQDERWYEVRFWIQSDFETNDSDDIANVEIDFETNIDFQAVSPGDDYSADIDEISGLEMTGGVQGSLFDPLASNDDGDVGVHPPIPGPGQIQVQRQDLSYFQPTGIMITETLDPDFHSVRWATKDSSEMRAQKPILGQHVSQHGSNTDAIYLQQRLLGMGPQGQAPDPSATWPTDYYARWPKSKGGGDVVESMSCRVISNNSRIELRGTCTGLHVVTYAPVWDRTQFPEYTSTLDSWDITASIYQLDTGDTWSTATSLKDVTVSLDGFQLFPTSYASPVALMKQAYWAYTQNAVGGAKTDFWEWTFKEGLLYPQDFEFLRTFTISLETPDAIDISKPIRLDLKADSITGTDVTWRAGTTSEKSTNNAVFMLTSLTAYEYPRLD